MPISAEAAVEPGSARATGLPSDNRDIPGGYAARVSGSRAVEAMSKVEYEPTQVKSASWHILRQRHFLVYFVGSLVSNLGTWLQNTTQMLLAYQLTHSAF